MKKFMLLGLCASLCLSCAQDTEGTSGEEATPEEAATQKQIDVAAGEAMPYKITPFAPSAEFPDAQLEFAGYEDGRISFNVSGDSYQLGAQTPDAVQKSCANSGQGQHIHLIVDNEPYLAKYEPSFEYEFSEGGHMVLAFLSRSYHESIKTPEAHVAFEAKIQDGKLRGTGKITKPMLFYSRPKGVYEGKDTEKVMLDYYLVNADPEDYSVRAEINGQEFTFNEWIPRYIEGLPAGENLIRLTLLNKDGSAVETDYNPVERKFVLNPEPAQN